MMDDFHAPRGLVLMRITPQGNGHERAFYTDISKRTSCLCHQSQGVDDSSAGTMECMGSL